MYKFPAKLKIGAIVLMVLGLVMTVISFMKTPKTLEEAKVIMAEQTANASGHGSHGDVRTAHPTESHTDGHHSDTKKVEEGTQATVEYSEETTTHHEVKDTVKHHVEDAKNLEGHAKDAIDKVEEVEGHLQSSVLATDRDETHTDLEHTTTEEEHREDTHATIITQVGNHSNAGYTDVHGNIDAHSEHHGDHHAEHVFHQLQNRPVSAFYVAMLFFLGISLLVMAFYAAQRVAQAGWSVVLFRVFEAITNNLHYVSVVMLLFIIGTAMHKFHLFPWMKEGTLTPGSENFDPIVYGKKWFLNIPGWTIRSVVYLIIWNVLRFIIRKMSIKQDNGDLKLHKKLFNMSVAFIATFLVTESMMSWDWIMGIDPHWFSTLFGWYVLATFLVCALTVVAMVTIYLRSVGALPLINDSHIHDLAKFMFGFSVFWTYLWFAQFMLVWYADMPEETTYFLQRFEDYKVLFLGMVAMNFVFPVLVLLNSDFKSIPWFVIIAGVVILAGHYIDLYVMIMPGTVGGQYGFGIGEIGGLLFFIGLFIFATFSAFARVSSVPKGNPFLHESETFHYYNIKHRGESSHNSH